MWLRFGPSDISDSLGFSDSSGSLHLKNSGRIHSKGRRRDGLLSMSESQTQAYLTARDVLRRVQRSSAFAVNPPRVLRARRYRRARTAESRRHDQLLLQVGDCRAKDENQRPRRCVSRSEETSRRNPRRKPRGPNVPCEIQDVLTAMRRARASSALGSSMRSTPSR